MDTPSNRTSRPRLARTLAALCLGAVLAVVGIELGFRAWNSLQGRPYDGQQSELRLGDFVARLEGLDFAPRDVGQEPDIATISLHPYQGFQVKAAWRHADTAAEYFDTQAGRDNFDIILLGGSVAAGFGRWASSSLVPALAADPRLAGRKVIVHNRACPGHKQPQQTTNLEWALSLGLRPDAVLLLDGFNEIAVAANNALYGVHPLFPAWLQMQTALDSPLNDPDKLAIVADIFQLRRSAEQLEASARGLGLMRSAALGGIVERKFAAMNSRSAALLAQLQTLTDEHEEERPMFVRGPEFVNEPANVTRMSVRAWMEGSRSIDALCRRRGIQFIHILQPAARDIGSKPLTAGEEARSLEPALWKQAIERDYPRLREAGAELAREGINFHDGSQVFADHPEEIYLDACHFEGAGNMILGAYIAQMMLETWPKD